MREELDSRLAQAIEESGVPVVTVFAVRLARIGYAMAVEDAKRTLAERAAKFREVKHDVKSTAFWFGEESEACAGVVGRLKPCAS